MSIQFWFLTLIRLGELNFLAQWSTTYDEEQMTKTEFLSMALDTGLFFLVLMDVLGSSFRKRKNVYTFFDKVFVVTTFLGMLKMCSESGSIGRYQFFVLNCLIAKQSYFFDK